MRRRAREGRSAAAVLQSNSLQAVQWSALLYLLYLLYPLLLLYLLLLYLL
jgi:hypothetical protein